jgi:hypothetical protein
MVMPVDASVYRFFCTKCDWSKMYMIENVRYSIFRRREKISKTPKKCPLCGGELKKEKMYFRG